ncbi:MAG: lipopolysaccharide biosynthesis protein [Gammaproteobacteria bacterium]|nr:lipopolysaccharide biosynthesis protein [Gammaproteobacteria bacterium]
MDTTRPPANTLKQRMAHSMLWLASSKTVVQFLSLLSTLAVVRILDPSDYGTMAVVTLLVGVSAMFSEFGIGSAIIQFPAIERRELNGCFWLSLVLALVLYAILYVCAPLIGQWFDNAAVPSVLRTAGLALPVSTLRVVPDALLRREMRFDSIARAHIAAAALSIPTVIGLAVAGAGVWALVASVLVMAVVQTIAMFVSTRWMPGLDAGSSRVREMIDFARHTLGSRVCWTVYQQSDIVMLGHQVTAGGVGIYSMAMQLVAFPIERLFSMVNEIAYPAMAQNQADLRGLRYSLLRSLKLVMLLALPMYVGLALVAPDLVPLVLTAKWAAAVPILQILCAYGIVSSLAVLQAPVLMARYRPDLMFRYSLAQLLIMPVAFWAGSVWAGEIGVALAWVLVYPLGLAWLTGRMIREVNLGWDDLFGCLTRPLIAVAAMAIVVTLVQASLGVMLSGQPLARVLLTIAAGALSYASVIWLVERRFVLDVLRLFSSAWRPASS